MIQYEITMGADCDDDDGDYDDDDDDDGSFSGIERHEFILMPIYSLHLNIPKGHPRKIQDCCARHRY